MFVAQSLFQYQNKSDRIILPGAFCELDEVCSEVPEDSRVLRVRCLWFLKSDHLQPWLNPFGTTHCRQFYVSTIVWLNLPPYHRFLYFVLSFQTKRAWHNRSQHHQRWCEGQVASDHCWLVLLFKSHHFGENELGLEAIRGREPQTAHCFNMGSAVKWVFCAFVGTMWK